MQTDNNLNIVIYTFYYNEMPILPFIIDYWKQYANKVIIYNNSENSNICSYLNNIDWIEVREGNKGKFDPLELLQQKNTIWKEAINNNIDFVIISDIDEALYAENIIDIFKNAKNENCNIIQTPIYDCLNKHLPYYIPGIFAHEYKDSICIYDTAKNKTLIFNPNNTNITFFNRDKTNISGHKKIYKQNIYCIHLKLFGLDKMKAIISSEKTNYKYIKDMLYGSDIASCTIKYNQIFCNSYIYTNKLSLKQKSIVAKNKLNPLSYKDVKWENTSLISNDRNYNGLDKTKKCIIVIPVYKQVLSEFEDKALKQGIKILGDTYEICICCPNYIYKDYYIYNYNYNFSFLTCADGYFSKLISYSWMCECPEWYRCFNEYEYMLIYLLDGWIFENKLDYFISLGYDYIGSPWRPGAQKFILQEAVGNGGVSLRKILTFIKICENINFEEHTELKINYEDLLFCCDLNNLMNIADIETAMNFCLDEIPEYWYRRNNNKLSMAAHAWLKHEFTTFWSLYIKI